jgi:hypothetical protein
LPKNNEIQEGARQGKKHHRDADGVDVHAVGQFQCAGSGGESTDANEKGDAVESDAGTTDALREARRKSWTS